MSAAPVIIKSIKYTVQVNGQTLTFDKPLVRIGRDPENDIALTKDSRVSRFHAEIYFDKGSLYLRNVSQKNYVLVNHQPIEEILIQGRLVAEMGETQLNIEADSLALQEPPKSNLLQPLQLGPTSLSQAPSKPLAQPKPPPQMGAKKPSMESGFGYAEPPTAKNPDQGRLRFYLIVAGIGALLYFFVLNDSGKKKVEVQIRSDSEVQRAIEESATSVQELQRQQEKKGEDSLQYKTAQQHYIKGFRDYRQGQYARAMQSFQAALSFHPSHELARKYWALSKRKFDELVQFNMIQGRRYLEKHNFRLCRSSFANVMIMLKDPNDQVYREAKQFYDECQTRLEGKF
ncbi:MAG: FHA domain-containing protein [Proteobacteria bacterium]|nr:FHA domain-containing protein [Pseudomonadota bacterium]